ncbi:MAG: glycosyltransferase family 4 protein [Bacteroidetes bacterium]|nr:glycosyltransferase family 4 protein [Bacteroidota bacterium]
MKKILYIKSGSTTFYAIDQAIMEERFTVVPYLLPKNLRGWLFIRSMLSLAGFILKNQKGSSAFVTWFGDYHAAIIVFMARLFGKKAVIFAGGQEAISYPELKKGVYYKKFRGLCVKYALRNTSHIIPNHKSLIWHENFYYSEEGKKDGIKYYIPDIKTPMTIISNGVDTTKFYRDNTISKEDGRILTVGTMGGISDFYNKGFDLFIEMARRMPEMKFTLIGFRKEFMPWIEQNYRVSEIPNLETLLYFCPDDVLFMNYNRARVFVQASITEGMPFTLNEAMLCECIPVGSNVNGIPDAIGNTGVIVKKRSPDALEAAIRKAFQLSTAAEARQRALDNFSMPKHREKLLELFEQILS